MPSRRLFYLMVKLSPALGAFIAEFVRLSAERPTDLLHMTLLPFGERSSINMATLARIVAILDAITLPSFRVAFDSIGGRDRTVLFASEPPRGALAFQHALTAALAGHGLRMAPSYRFRPHVTLDYRRGVDGSVAIDPISWLVEDIRLIESIVGETRHVEHGRWTLGGMDRAA